MKHPKIVHRVTFAAMAALSGTISTDTALRLLAHHVPVPQTASCTLCTLSILVVTGRQAADALVTTTYRCQVEGCDFKVSCRLTDPGESRRWQEAAASHPRHL